MVEVNERKLTFSLGNVGVIAAGLVIWFCQGRWTLYFDPAVSLLITCIIFSSALPLGVSRSLLHLWRA